MGSLADLNRQLQLAQGQPVPPTQDDILRDCVGQLVQAIGSVELTEAQRADYSDALSQIASAIKGSQKGSDALVKAIKGLEIRPEFTVESPTVNVEAPHVEVKAEFDIPEGDPREFVIKRDNDGRIMSVIERPFVPEPEKKPEYTIE